MAPLDSFALLAPVFAPMLLVSTVCWASAAVVLGVRYERLRRTVEAS